MTAWRPSEILGSGPINLHGIFSHLHCIFVSFRSWKDLQVFPAGERTLIFSQIPQLPCLFMSPAPGINGWKRSGRGHNPPSGMGVSRFFSQRFFLACDLSHETWGSVHLPSRFQYRSPIFSLGSPFSLRGEPRQRERDEAPCRDGYILPGRPGRSCQCRHRYR